MAEVGCSIRQVENALQRAGLRGYESDRVAALIAQDDRIEDLHSEGRTHRQIRAEVGCSLYAVHAALRRRGWEEGPCKDRLQDRVAAIEARDLRIEKRYMAGQTYARIAEGLGISPSTVRAALKRRGWD